MSVDVEVLVAVLNQAHHAKRVADKDYKAALHDLLRAGSDCDVMRATGMSKDAVRMYRKRHPQVA